MNPHFVEIPKAFRDEEVEHLVIGAHALAAHGHVRATLDIDIWVNATGENAGRTWRGGSKIWPTLKNSTDQRSRIRASCEMVPATTSVAAAKPAPARS